MGRHKTKKNNTKKKIYVFALFLLFIGGLVTLFILNPHPGYKRLEKELDAIKLPDGWIEVGPRGGEKDYWNIFCRDVTIDCPSVSTKIFADNSNGTLDNFGDFFKINEITTIKKSNTCKEFNEIDGSQCYLIGVKNKISYSITKSEFNNSSEIYGVSVEKRNDTE